MDEEKGVLSIRATKIITNKAASISDHSKWDGEKINFVDMKDLYQKKKLKFDRKFNSLSDRDASLPDNIKNMILVEYYK